MSAQPVVDRASFYISVSDRSKVSPVIYQYIVDHAQGHTPATILDTVGVTFKQALEAIRATPRIPSGLASSGRCGWMSSWPPGWWRCRSTAWT
jgi:hypothetical protein